MGYQPDMEDVLHCGRGIEILINIFNEIKKCKEFVDSSKFATVCVIWKGRCKAGIQQLQGGLSFIGFRQDIFQNFGW
jgi:hypothetical protein